MTLQNSAKRAKGMVPISLVTIALLTFAGCAPFQTKTGESESDLSVERWQGRMSVVVESVERQVFSANFDLQGSSEKGQMELSTPIGTTLARLQWSTQEAHLFASGTKRSYPSLRELTLAAMGAELPVDSLFQWLNGTPSESVGWQSDLSAYGAGRLTAQRDFPTPRVNLKIVMDR